MKNIATKWVFALILLFSCKGGKFPEVISFGGEGYTIKVYSKSGELKVGLNDIMVEVQPPAKIEEFYLYMPPMPGMPEMRAFANIKEKGKGIYEGKISISMEGSWQIRAKVDGKVLKRDINIPLRGEKHMHEGMDMGNVMELTAAKLAAFNVSTYKVDTLSVPAVIYASGSIKYPKSKTFMITPRFSGYITEIFVDREGSFVERGTPLFEFYSPEIVRTYEEYINAKETGDSVSLTLTLEKFSIYGISPDDVKDTLAVFRSPSSGKVSKVMVAKGMMFSENQSLYELVTGKVFYFVGEVPQEKAKHLYPGSLVEIEGIYARLDRVFPEVNPETKTIRFISVFTTERDLYEGMILTAKIKRMVKGLFVPKDAVIRTGTADFVYLKVRDNAFLPKRVKVLSEVENGYMVEGLKVGDEVVAKGVFFIDAEANLRGLR
ncbi:MAG: efflux RND transporter periplasmic adaptor subunit [candidate division WOR-3 bacterium]